MKIQRDKFKKFIKFEGKYLGSKFLFLIEAIFILLVVGYIYFSYKPSLISPYSGLVIDDFNFNFEIENSDKVVLSRTLDLKEKIVLQRGKDALLLPGTYYWKAVSFFGESEVRNFTIRTRLVLSLSSNEDGDETEDVNLSDYGEMDSIVKSKNYFYDKNGLAERREA